MEDLSASLDNYKVQLSQVEAALSVDAENEELVKLKQDLQEVIQLTQDLIGADEEAAESSAAKKRKTEDGPKWKVGDRCLAFNQRSHKYDEAAIQDLLPEGETVLVKFDNCDDTDMCQVSSLKPTLTPDVPSLEGFELNKGKLVSKKEKLIQMREYKKKRNLKKKMKLKEKEAKFEISTNKWKDFNKKAFAKSSKGKVKKSIFASPEGLDGKVGIGTCGVADKSMTKYEHGAKYNARHLIPR